jgi:hypothetical protein
MPAEKEEQLAKPESEGRPVTSSKHLFHRYRKEATDDHNPFVNTGPGVGN